MVDSRVLTAAVGLLASVAVSLFVYRQYDTLLVFLFLPFLPILFRRGVEAEALGEDAPDGEVDVSSIDDGAAARGDGGQGEVDTDLDVVR